MDMSFEELTEISVASLFSESRLEASSSVSLIKESEWQSNGARRTNEIMMYQTSAVPYTFLGGSNVFAIRGYSNRLSARGVATLLDGVPLNTFSFGTAQYFLSNIKIRKYRWKQVVTWSGL